MPCPTHSVIPGRRAAASPESITTGLSAQITARAYGFRGPSLRSGPGMTSCGLRNAWSSMASTVIYVRNVIYANDVTYGPAYPGPHLGHAGTRHYVKNVIYAGVVIYGSRLDDLGIRGVVEPRHVRGAALADAAAVERALVGDLAGIERRRFSQHQRASDRPRRGGDAAVHLL
jgi:hypothetical protein